MRRTPNFIYLLRYPATGGTIIFALALSVAWWSRVNVEMLLVDPAVAHGQLWRLVTSALFHANLIHLLFNVWWMWYLGTIVEERWGSGRAATLFVYLVLASGAAEFALLDGCVGLSGVVFGLCGFVWMASWKDESLADVLDAQSVVMILACFVMGVVLSVLGALPIANIAHLVGAGLGAIAGWSATRATRTPAAALPVVGAIGLLLMLATWARPYINRSSSAGEQEAFRGYHALSAGENDAALDWFRDATVARPGSASWWFDLGVAEHRAGNWARAASAYDRAAQLDPANLEFRNARDSMQRFVSMTTQPS